jgi:phage recombination protein Bet
MEPMLNPDQLRRLKGMVDDRMTDEQFKTFVEAINKYRLDPFARQIYAVLRSDRGQLKVSVECQIDGYRLLADRTKQYAGSRDAVFDDEGSGAKPPAPPDRPPGKATVSVFKFLEGEAREFSASARWNEYYPGSDSKGFFWRRMPCGQLAKCAEALALRKAFPQELSGLYVQEEMDQAGSAGASEKGNKQVDKPAISTRAAKAIEQIQTGRHVKHLWGVHQKAVADFDTEPDRTAVLSALSGQATTVLLEKLADISSGERGSKRSSLDTCRTMFTDPDWAKIEVAFAETSINPPGAEDNAGRLEPNPDILVCLLREHEASSREPDQEKRRAGVQSRLDQASDEFAQRLEACEGLPDLDALAADADTYRALVTPEIRDGLLTSIASRRKEFAAVSQEEPGQ